MQNAAARLIFRLRRSDHITDVLINLHWLLVPKRILFKVAVQTYQGLHGDVPQYLRQFTLVADIPTRQRLWSSTSDDLCVPAVRLPTATVGRRAVSVACVWNALPADVTSALFLLTSENVTSSNSLILALSPKFTFSPFVVPVDCGSHLLLRPR